MGGHGTGLEGLFAAAAWGRLTREQEREAWKDVSTRFHEGSLRNAPDKDFR